MAKAKKLPSGAYRIRVYSHTENGKKIYESITGYNKADVELKAAEFKAIKKRRMRLDLTVKDAIDRYISSKEHVLSPSTLREYRRLQKHNFKEIEHKKIKSISSEDLQRFVNDKAVSLSPKSVRNTYGLLSASIALFQPDIHYRVTLPQKTVFRPESPSDEAVQSLLDNSKGVLHTCILLGIRGFRAGEICALKYEDVQNGIAHIHADMVKGPDKKWHYKEVPKNSGSDRFVRVPDLGEGDGFIIPWTPAYLTKRFIYLRNSLGVSVRFHDLRHFFASKAAVLNIPDLYTADMGGWSRGGNSSVMKSVYQNNIRSMSDYYAEKMEEHLRKFK